MIRLRQLKPLAQLIETEAEHLLYVRGTLVAVLADLARTFLALRMESSPRFQAAIVKRHNAGFCTQQDVQRRDGGRATVESHVATERCKGRATRFEGKHAGLATGVLR